MLMIKPKGNRLNYVTISYKDYKRNESLEFYTSTYDRVSVNRSTRIFSQFNQYLETLPDPIQAQIFDVYHQTHAHANSIVNLDRLHEKLNPLIVQYYQLLDIDRLRQWMYLHIELFYIPEDLKVDYHEDMGPRGSTYTREQYKGLIFLALLFQGMMPIFGEYIRMRRNDLNSDMREYIAMSLLRGTGILQIPEIDRLREYANTNSEYGKLSATALHGGLGAVELPEWLLALIVVRRLAVAEVGPFGVNLCSDIFKFLKNRLVSLDKKKHVVRDKHHSKSKKHEEDNTSLAEDYKIKQEVPDSDPILCRNYVRELPYEAALSIDSTVSIELVKACLVHVRKIPLEIRDHHVRLCALLMDAVMSPRVLRCLYEQEMRNVIGICQAILYHQGHHYFAHILTANFDNNDEVMTLTAPSRLSKASSEMLMPQYPNYQTRNPKRDRDKMENEAVKFIDLVVKDLERFRWIYQSPQFMFDDHPNQDLNGHVLRVPTSIRNQLAKLITQINQAKETRYASD